jgi:hypothetical protein
MSWSPLALPSYRCQQREIQVNGITFKRVITHTLQILLLTTCVHDRHECSYFTLAFIRDHLLIKFIATSKQQLTSDYPIWNLIRLLHTTMKWGGWCSKRVDITRLQLPGFQEDSSSLSVSMGKKRKHKFLHNERTKFLKRLHTEREERTTLETWAAIKMQAAARGFIVRCRMKHDREGRGLPDPQAQWSREIETLQTVKHDVLSIRRVLLEMNEATEQQLALDKAANDGKSSAKRSVAWASTKKKVKKRRRKDMKEFVVKMQSIVRGFLARRAVKLLHKRVEEEGKRSVIIKIQALARGYLVRNGVANLDSAESREAAITIQAAVRGWITRIRIRRLRWAIQEHIIKTNCAIKIQKLFRGRRDRKEADEKLQGEKAVVIQKHIKGKLARKELSKQKAAATSISATYKGARARRQYRRNQQIKREVEETEAAIKLQKVTRGHNTRKTLAQKKAEEEAKRAEEANALKNMKEEEQSSAAVKIQSIVRGKADRKKAAALKEEKEQHDAAMKIQSIQRAKQAKKEVQLLREEKKQHDSATKIQAIHRGKQARKDVEVLKKAKEEEDQRQAAVKIQSIHRGREARKSVSSIKAEKRRAEEDEAATKLQASFRGYKARSDVKRVRGERREALERDADNDGPKRAVRRAGRK